MEEKIPDGNLFMVCKALKQEALRGLPHGFYVRYCRPDELGIWMSMPFDTPVEAKENSDYMQNFYERVYEKEGKLFFETCLFVCNGEDVPVGTCFVWKAYGQINTLHWFKVVKEYEGKGLGRGLLSKVLGEVPQAEYPIYLHTQPGSYRAIKLYSDFGFCLLRGPAVGSRTNDLEKCLPVLKRYMPEDAYNRLAVQDMPEELLRAAMWTNNIEF